ncbi:hypothetical protein BCR44DRAFT_1418786 [Catenaria anguillulae PL171]|uniref:Uncharacterized protein n=1 Tax=Catenaria anguillulae PL171 TaxID=765915 RepID=A0A1Y2H7G6_9FUNG|nr:hypothetical protein BCR44DRAFT_1418786 [Catenaria anguillulae PL171]
MKSSAFWIPGVLDVAFSILYLGRATHLAKPLGNLGRISQMPQTSSVNSIPKIRTSQHYAPCGTLALRRG